MNRVVYPKEKELTVMAQKKKDSRMMGKIIKTAVSETYFHHSSLPTDFPAPSHSVAVPAADLAACPIVRNVSVIAQR